MTENKITTLEIKLNEIVVVEFNEKSKEIYTEYENRKNDFAKKLFPNISERKKDLNGELRFQLWELFDIFGKFISLGNPSLFINNSLKINLK